jgi:hypothetical protein
MVLLVGVEAVAVRVDLVAVVPGLRDRMRVDAQVEGTAEGRAERVGGLVDDLAVGTGSRGAGQQGVS